MSCSLVTELQLPEKIERIEYLNKKIVINQNLNLRFNLSDPMESLSKPQGQLEDIDKKLDIKTKHIATLSNLMG